MRYDVIATGSQGNAVVLNGNILIDCGIPFKALGEVYEDLKLVLLTHEHSDHFKPSTIKKLAEERPTLRFGCCPWLVKSILACDVSKRNIDVYECGKVYKYGFAEISPVRLYHNVLQCGYRVFADGEKAIYMTDTGHLRGISAMGYNLYLIEANYENAELQERIRAKQGTGEYCYELRVSERHLSKEQADAFLLENMAEHSRYQYLHQHIGSDND